MFPVGPTMCSIAKQFMKKKRVTRNNQRIAVKPYTVGVMKTHVSSLMIEMTYWAKYVEAIQSASMRPITDATMVRFCRRVKDMYRVLHILRLLMGLGLDSNFIARC